jgi:hypothetical protein
LDLPWRLAACVQAHDFDGALLHRDLKLDNCLCFESDVKGECDVKLGDFGCFKHMRCGQADDESYR